MPVVPRPSGPALPPKSHATAWDSFAHGVGAAADTVKGVAKQSVNSFWRLQPVVGKGRGDVFEPVGRSELRGADAVDGLLAAVRLAAPVAHSADEVIAPRTAGRERQQLLATLRTDVPTGSTAPLSVRFRAGGEGLDWGREGHEASSVSVFVDGRYLSDAPVLAERREPVTVNLGVLPAGAHEVQLRSGASLSAPGTPDPKLREVSIAPVHGDAALADRYAPLLQMRDLGLPGGRLEATYTDSPLLVSPKVKRLHDGSATITYYAMFSNEDGGTTISTLVHETGRSVDFEPIARVHVDRAGNRIGDIEFQGPLHHDHTFDGTFYGERPVLRVSTANNNFSARLHVGGALWSPSTTPLTEPHPSLLPRPTSPMDHGITTGTDLAMMQAHPWIFPVQGKEMLRERTPIVTGVPRDVASDFRHMLLVPAPHNPVRRRLDRVGTLDLRLKGGGKATLVHQGEPSVPRQTTAVPLPAGVVGARLASIVAPAGGTAIAMDARFRPIVVRSRLRPAVSAPDSDAPGA